MCVHVPMVARRGRWLSSSITLRLVPWGRVSFGTWDLHFLAMSGNQRSCPHPLKKLGCKHVLNAQLVQTPVVMTTQTVLLTTKHLPSPTHSYCYVHIILGYSHRTEPQASKHTSSCRHGPLSPWTRSSQPLPSLSLVFDDITLLTTCRTSSLCITGYVAIFEGEG